MHDRPQDNQPAFVLHSYPYRETSLIVEGFTREFGRVAWVARGARRPRAALRGVLMPFQPLNVSWFGKGELRTLKSAEWQGGQPALGGAALVCGFYLNELLLKLLPREDPHPLLFERYRETLRALSESGLQPQVLRRFEKGLMQELGYAAQFEREAGSDAPIDAERSYVYAVEQGPLRESQAQNGVQLRGKTLLDIARDDYSDPVTLAQAKQLMRFLISHHLGGDALQTRQLLLDLQSL